MLTCARVASIASLALATAVVTVGAFRSTAAIAANASQPATPVATSPGAAAPALAAPTVPTKTFVTIGERPAVLFDAPSDRANKNFIMQRGTPLEVLVKLGRWTKIRDSEGSIGWVENTTLSTLRHVQVSTSFAEVRATALTSASIVFEAQRGVLLEVTGSIVEGWVPVRHRDGQAGFVKQTQVWGD